MRDELSAFTWSWYIDIDVSPLDEPTIGGMHSMSVIEHCNQKTQAGSKWEVIVNV